MHRTGGKRQSDIQVTLLVSHVGQLTHAQGRAYCPKSNTCPLRHIVKMGIKLFIGLPCRPIYGIKLGAEVD